MEEDADFRIVEECEEEDDDSDIVIIPSEESSSDDEKIKDAILLSLDPEAYSRKRHLDEYTAALRDAAGFDRHGRQKRPRLDSGPFQTLIDKCDQVIFNAIVPFLLVEERWDWVVDFFCVCRGLYHAVFRSYDAEKNMARQSWLEKFRAEERPKMLRLRVIPDAYRLLSRHYGEEERDGDVSFRRNAEGCRVVFRLVGFRGTSTDWQMAVKCLAKCDASFHVAPDTVLYIRETHCVKYHAYKHHADRQVVDYRQMSAGAPLTRIKLEGRVVELMNGK